MINRKIVLSLTALAAINLASCSISTILPEPAPANTVYRLTSAVPTAPSLAVTASNGFTVRIDRPSAAKALQGFDLLVVQDANKLVSIKGAEWADSLPTLIQRSFLSHVDARSDFTGLLPTSGARSKYRVHITVRNFEAWFDQGRETAPLIVADYLVTFSDAGTRRLIGTETFRVEDRAPSIRVSDIVTTKSAANNTLLHKISDWMALSLSRDTG